MFVCLHCNSIPSPQQPPTAFKGCHIKILNLIIELSKLRDGDQMEMAALLSVVVIQD